MKSLILLSLVIAAIYFGFTSNTNKNIVFNNEEYKLARTEGTDGFYKYHYTKSGRDTGNNNYIEVLQFSKSETSADKAKETAKYIRDVYKTKYISGSSGQFGIFGQNNNQYAHTIRSENSQSYFFINYVLQSATINARVAKTNALQYINALEDLAFELSN